MAETRSAPHLVCGGGGDMDLTRRDFVKGLGALVGATIASQFDRQLETMARVLKRNMRPKHIFYCPYCKQATWGVIVQNGLFTQSCQNCKRTFLAMAGTDMPGRARAVHHPDCDQGCGYHEPYGWVISADCTVHDPLPG